MRRNFPFFLTALLFCSSVCSSCSYETGLSGIEYTDSKETASEYGAEISFDTHMDISIGYWNIDAMVKSPTPDAVTKHLETMFNVTFHPVSVTWTNYKERYQILEATGSLPDLFATLTLSSNDTNDSAAYADMIENRSIRPLPQDLSAFPHIRQMLDSVSYMRSENGEYYAIPRISFSDPILGSTDAAMLVRRDWMNALKLEDPQSFDEFCRMAAAFATEDPDGNGLDDTIGYNVNNLSALGKWVILGIAPPCNVYSWIEQDGSYLPSWYTEDFKKVVACYRQLYTSGGLDPHFYSKSPSNVMDDFAAGRLGALEYKSSPSALMELKTLWDEQNDLSFEDCVDILPIFPAPDGIRYSNSSNIFWSESFLSSSVSDEKAMRILAILEYMFSEEGVRLGRYGLEGIDYSLSKEGEYTCLMDLSGQNLTTALKQKYPSLLLFSSIASWGGNWEDFSDHELNALRYGDVCVKLAGKSVKWCQENTRQLERPYNFLTFPKEATEAFSTSMAFENFIKCILGSSDPVVMWENYIRQMQAQGLDLYIEEQNLLFREHH